MAEQPKYKSRREKEREERKNTLGYKVWYVMFTLFYPIIAVFTFLFSTIVMIFSAISRVFAYIFSKLYPNR